MQIGKTIILANRKQINMIRARIRAVSEASGYSIPEYTTMLKERMNLESFKGVTFEQADNLIKEIQLDEVFLYKNNGREK